jgi:hypothetical protein
MPTSSANPRARTEQLIVEEVKDEILIYDETSQRASCLNPTATLVWKYCDGQTSAAEIAARMSRELGSPVDTRFVWFALDQLDKKKLLVEPIQVPAQYGGMTRRDFLTKAGLVGAAVAIPVVISLVAPTPAMAATPAGCGDPCQPQDGCDDPCTCEIDGTSPTGFRCEQ